MQEMSKIKEKYNKNCKNIAMIIAKIMQKSSLKTFFKAATTEK